MAKGQNQLRATIRPQVDSPFLGGTILARLGTPNQPTAAPTTTLKRPSVHARSTIHLGSNCLLPRLRHFLFRRKSPKLRRQERGVTFAARCHRTVLIPQNRKLRFSRPFIGAQPNIRNIIGRCIGESDGLNLTAALLGFSVLGRCWMVWQASQWRN